MDQSKLEALKRYYATQCGIKATIELSTLRKLIALAERTTSPVSQAPAEQQESIDSSQYFGKLLSRVAEFGFNGGHEKALIEYIDQHTAAAVAKAYAKGRSNGARDEANQLRAEHEEAIKAKASLAQPQPVAEQKERDAFEVAMRRHPCGRLERTPPLLAERWEVGPYFGQYKNRDIEFGWSMWVERAAIVASQPEAKAAPAKAEANWTAEEAADFAANPSGLDESRMSLAARVAGMAIRKSVPDEALMFQIKRLQSLLTKPHRELIERAIQWHEAGREAQEVRRLVPSQVTDAATPWAIHQPQALHDAGSALANIAFNLAQRPGHTLTSRECETMDKCRKDWDAAKKGGAA